MSHYSLAVFHRKDQNIEELLEPFDIYKDVPVQEDELFWTYNARGKWDEWCVGGRFSGLLKIGGIPEDSGRVGDIDFTMDESLYNRYLRIWDVAIDHKKPEPEESYKLFFSEEYYREYFIDRETFARYCAQFSTYAVLMPDGKWYERGPVDCFGLPDDTAEETQEWEEHYKQRFLDSADPDWILTIVDCHI